MPSCPARAVGTGLGNYTISYVNGSLTVDPAALTITADSTSKTYGQTVTFAGTEFTDERPGQWRHGEQRDVTSPVLRRRRRWLARRMRSCPSAAVGTGLGNYTITYVNGRLTVTRRR